MVQKNIHYLNGLVYRKGEPMVKPNARTDMEYHNINGYTQMRNSIGNFTCTCKGYIFRKKCRHIEELCP